MLEGLYTTKISYLSPPFFRTNASVVEIMPVKTHHVESVIIISIRIMCILAKEQDECVCEDSVHVIYKINVR